MLLNVTEYLALLSVCAMCVTTSRRHRSSHRPVIFPNDDPYTCTTPLRQPGMCVPIDHCPQLRRVGLRRLSKYICGFEQDTPLLCCELSSVPPPLFAGLPPLTPPPLPPQTIRPELLDPLPPHHGPTPIPLLCTSLVRDGRRWRSCWYLALQRVDILEDQDAPLGSPEQHPLPASGSGAGGGAIPGSGFAAAQPPAENPSLTGSTEPSTSNGGSSLASGGESAGNRPSSLGGPNRPNKTSVTSQR